MIPYFAVGAASVASRILAGRNALISFAWIGSTFIPAASVARLAKSCLSVVLDSGAFTAWSQGKPVELARYAAYVQEHHVLFDWCASLDAIGDAAQSRRNWLALRAAVPTAKIVPVFHEGEEPALLDEYVSAAPLVGLGRIEGRRSIDATFAWYDAVFNRHPEGRFHGFGNSAPETLEPYPFHSFDSSTWERDSAYGAKHRFPWSRCSKETRMRAYLEALATIEHRPQGRQLLLPTGDDSDVRLT